jgi:4-carboxymuconolactone decarboxylase
LVTVAALTALNRPNALRLNIEMALNNGAKKQEILETLLQMAPYAGFPACWEALLIADEVLKGAKGNQQSPQSESPHN